MSDDKNLAIWNGWPKVAGHTKPIPGGANLSSVEATWQLQEATRIFGPYGMTWWLLGVEYIPIVDGGRVTTIAATGTFFYPVGDSIARFTVAADMDYRWEKSGKIQDDVWKKLLKELRSKALLLLGFGAELALDKGKYHTDDGGGNAGSPPPPQRQAAAPQAAGAVPNCPQCGSPMRERSGKKGPFYGCTGYPNCKGTLPIGGGAPPAQAAGGNVQVISAPQAKRLWAIFKGHEPPMPEGTLREMMRLIAGVAHSKDIPRDKYEALCNAVEAWQPPNFDDQEAKEAPPCFECGDNGKPGGCEICGNDSSLPF